MPVLPVLLARARYCVAGGAAVTVVVVAAADKRQRAGQQHARETLNL